MKPHTLLDWFVTAFYLRILWAIDPPTAGAVFATWVAIDLAQIKGRLG